MKIVAMFAYCERDEHYVADLLDNISWVDDIIAYDNRGKEYDERAMRLQMKRLAIQKGADWILELDPDERFEKSAEKIIREVTKTKHKTIYRVNFRELYSPDEYRVDGIWGRKYRFSLYPVYPNQKIKNQKYNLKTWPINREYKRVPLNLNLYHLKMIDPKAREDRVKWLKEIDPNSETQRVGYDYLVDESGMKLEKIPEGREYTWI